MTRLASYLVRLFAADALALFGIAALLLFLAQALRSFDVVAVKGQDVLTLLGQSLLTMPTLAIAFAHVCIGIGLARGLRTLQLSQELHIIHSSRRLPALFGSITTYALGGMLIVLILTHLLEPMTRRYYDSWAASVAADLVSRTLTPHKFIQITPGVTLVIGSRGLDGELGSFFADDRRNPEVRVTYMAESASVAADGDGYVVRLVDGQIQYMSGGRQFSAIAFARYDLAVERLIGVGASASGALSRTSIDLISEAIAQGSMSSHVGNQLGARTGEGFRVLALCLLVAAMAAFPHGRRGGRDVPLEIVVLGVAFGERAITGLVTLPTAGIPFGSILILVASLIVLWVRTRVPAKRARGARA